MKDKNEIYLIRSAGSMMTIDEAMATCKEFKNKQELIDYLNQYGKWSFENYDNTPDERNGWPYTNLILDKNGYAWLFYTSGITLKKSMQILRGRK